MINQKRVLTTGAGRWMALLFLWCVVTLAGCAGNRVPIDTAYPTRPMSLPGDLAAHDEAETEWWYYTGHLEDAEGGRYGFELTFFKRRIDNDKPWGIPVGWINDTALMAHFSVTREDTAEFVQDGRTWFSNKNIYARTDRYEVAYKDWKAGGDMERHTLTARTKDTAIDLSAIPIKPPVLHGTDGIVPKGENRANYYMSFTRLDLAGTLVFKGKEISVTGTAWFDHEFGYMGTTAVSGWDWFSLQMEDATEYMLYALRLKDGTIDPVSHAFRIDPEGNSENLPLSDLDITVLSRWKSPHNGAVYPSAWRIVAAPWDLDVIVIPTVADQEFRYHDIVYWEGSCGVYGKPANGRAYVELVGYCPWKAMADLLEE